MTSAAKEFVESAKCLAQLEHHMEGWRECLKACQEARKESEGAFEALYKEQEQVLKKLYWEASERYHTYKKRIVQL